MLTKFVASPTKNFIFTAEQSAQDIPSIINNLIQLETNSDNLKKTKNLESKIAIFNKQKEEIRREAFHTAVLKVIPYVSDINRQASLILDLYNHYQEFEMLPLWEDLVHDYFFNKFFSEKDEHALMQEGQKEYHFPGEACDQKNFISIYKLALAKANDIDNFNYTIFAASNYLNKRREDYKLQNELFSFTLNYIEPRLYCDRFVSRQILNFVIGDCTDIENISNKAKRLYNQLMDPQNNQKSSFTQYVNSRLASNY